MNEPTRSVARQTALAMALLASSLVACHGGGPPAKGPPPARDPATTRVAGEALICREHGVPEALCTRCNPALVPVFKARGDWCREHRFPESFCPICHPNAKFPDVGIPASATQSDAPQRAAFVRLGSRTIEATAGIETVAARRADVTTSVDCPARIAFGTNRVADVQAIVPGVIRRVLVDVGERVALGAPLFEIESLHVGELQGALRTAQRRVRVAAANVARHRRLHKSGGISLRHLELATLELATAQIQVRVAKASLRTAGAASATRPGRSAASGRYTLTAPLAGTVVRRPGVIGARATASSSLATIADTSVVQVHCQVAESAASKLALGQQIRVSTANSGQAPSRSTLSWIAAEVDPRTRTVTARADLANPTGALRAGQFASGRIITSAPTSAVVVPRAAIQRVDDTLVVFVRTSQGVYQPRVVRRLGGGALVRVQGEVKAGDPVVTTGAILLRTEMLPGSIGAGCCAPSAAGGK